MATPSLLVRRVRAVVGVVMLALVLPLVPSPVAAQSAGVPSAPSGLSAIAANGSATISFEVDDVGGSAISDVQFRVDSTSEDAWRSFDWMNEPWPGGRTHFVHTVDGLRNGRAQTVDLRVVNDAGPGPAASITVTPRATRSEGTTGEDFWFAYLDNGITGRRLTAFVAVTRDTRVTIMGAQLAQPIVRDILASEGIVEIEIATTDALAALLGPQKYDRTGAQRVATTEGRSVRLVADAPVTVYALNQVSSTTDAYVLIPSDGLGTRYRGASLWSIPETSVSLADTTAAMVIAATRNDTEVVISNVPVPGGGTTSIDLTLQAGQTFSYREPGTRDLTDPRLRNMSGRLITANRPIAVFSGNERVRTPAARHFPPVLDAGGSEVLVNPSPGGATDHAVSQLAPTSAWGAEFVAVRYPRTNAQGDLVLIVADTDGTEVTIDGELATTLDAGEFEVFRILPKPADGQFAGAVIRTSAPTQVYQYLAQGTFRIGTFTSTASNIGDPAMALLPPSEQFLADYTLAPVSPVFAFHAVNVVIPDGAVSSFRINGVAPDGSGAIPGVVADATFRPIGTSGYFGAQIHLLDASISYRFTASEGFGVFLYGGRQNDGYATPGGFAIRDLDTARAAANAPPVAVSGVQVVCEQDPALGCGGVTCRVSGGEPDIDILWRASVGGEAFAGEGVTLDGAGVGSFSFVPSRALVGSIIDVELVAWGASDAVTVAGCIPSSVPAGEGGVPMPLALLFAAIVSVAGAVLVGRRALAVG